MSAVALKAAYDKERRAVHSDRLRAQERDRYANNRERVLVRQKLYRENNRERIAVSTRKRRAANPEPGRAYKKEWCEANRARRRDQHLTKQYGITLQDYDAMSAAQGHACRICAVEAKTERFGVLHVDHDHTTGEVRGLLCANCNKAIGGFQDNREIMLKAIKYLDAANARKDPR